MDERPCVLVMDDDPIVRESLTQFLELEHYRVAAAETLQEAMGLLEGRDCRIVMADVRLPEGSGFDLLRHIKEQKLPAAVIMLTGYGTIEDAVQAIKMGAFDYVTKPISDDEVKLTIERALQQQRLIEENLRLREQLNLTFQSDEIIHRDPMMKRVLERILVMAGTDATLLITGESGTGKTLAARAIHRNSARKDGPFIEVSCGTLPDTLLESELFGHGGPSAAQSPTRGAGSTRPTRGRFSWTR